MAKKKLFGNTKEPRCETCAHGKLSVNGESVLCVEGGAVPLDHHCRRYQYDPLRRVPKRRPEMAEYTAADFALDDTPDNIVAAPSAESAVQTPEKSTFEHLFAYLDEHETPDADTIRAILNKTYTVEKTQSDKPQESPEETADVSQEVPEEIANEQPEMQDEPQEDAQEETQDEKAQRDETDSLMSAEEILDQLAREASKATDTPPFDDSPTIDGDLERLDMTSVPEYALSPITDIDEPLMLSKDIKDDMLFMPGTHHKVDAPLSVDDLLFLPKGTPSDHDIADDVGGGFTPLISDE